MSSRLHQNTLREHSGANPHQGSRTSSCLPRAPPCHPDRLASKRARWLADTRRKGPRARFPLEGKAVLDDYCFCRCCQLLNSKKGCFFALSMAHVFQTILSVDVKEKAIAALISTLKMVHSAPLLIIDATGTSNRLPSVDSSIC